MAELVSVLGLFISYLCALIALICLGVSIYLGVWRLVFSPIAQFPGPKLAALTLWYEFYFDVIKRGSYFREIAKMHEKYGTLL